MSPEASGRAVVEAKFREDLYVAMRAMRDRPEPSSGVRVGLLSYNETVAFDAIVDAHNAALSTAIADTRREERECAAAKVSYQASCVFCDLDALAHDQDRRACGRTSLAVIRAAILTDATPDQPSEKGGA